MGGRIIRICGGRYSDKIQTTLECTEYFDMYRLYARMVVKRLMMKEGSMA